MPLSSKKKASRASKTAEFDRAVAEFFMRLALDEAKKGLGRTSPNPVVGAILVKGGRVIARGYHRRAGELHAEAVVLQMAGGRAKGADLYVTLEPCNHFGRTPPCTDALIRAQVRRVVYASSDPNPLVNGKGLVRLRRVGIEVRGGVLKDEADALNRPFFKFMRTRMPYVTLKAGVTLDGKLATQSGDSKWVTGDAARTRVHQLRDTVDAILVGANTVLRDNPALTTRIPGGKDPLRVVVDSHLRVSPKSNVFTQKSAAKTVVATLEPATSAKAKKLAALGVDVWQVKPQKGRVDLKDVFARLAETGRLHLLVEGGADIFGSVLAANLADELWLFLAPKLVGRSGLSWMGELGVGKMAQAKTLKLASVEKAGDDVLVRALLPSSDS